MESMEVDTSEASTSAVTEPVEGSSSGTNATITSSTSQTTSVKSDLNAPWSVCFIKPRRTCFIFLVLRYSGLKNIVPNHSRTLLETKRPFCGWKSFHLVGTCPISSSLYVNVTVVEFVDFHYDQFFCILFYS